MRLPTILPLLVQLVACACPGEDGGTVLPQKISELQQRLKHKSRNEAYDLTLALFGKPELNVGSGFRIEQWNVDGGILTFHQTTGPTFRDSAGRVTWLVATTNEVAANIHSGFEMYSLAEQDPNKNGTGYWLGNLDLNSAGRYEYRDSGQHREYKKLFPTHFFAIHPKGEFRITYSQEVKPANALETIPDETEICRITFDSGGESRIFGIVTSRSERRLRFESDGQVFKMNRGWNEYWPKETPRQNKSLE